MTNNATEVPVIFETQNYKVQVGASLYGSKEGVNVYQLINKHHNVVERESTILVEILHNAKQLEEELAEFASPVDEDTGIVIDAPRQSYEH